MIRSSTNNDRLFVTRRSDVCKCRSGDNIIIECYVRHQRIRSIAWFANGELVDTKGVRLWHRYEPSTGQCRLFLRSVFKCDEGSYCCEATSQDDVVETLQLTLKIDNRDRAWTKIPALEIIGHVIPGGFKQSMSSDKT